MEYEMHYNTKFMQSKMTRLHSSFLNGVLLPIGFKTMNAYLAWFSPYNVHYYIASNKVRRTFVMNLN